MLHSISCWNDGKTGVLSIAYHSVDFASALQSRQLIRESFGIERYTHGLRNHHALFMFQMNCCDYVQNLSQLIGFSHSLSLHLSTLSFFVSFSLFLHTFYRDRSACVTLKRVSKPGGEPGELVDHWLEFYHRPENEKEFPLRNGQVKNCLILSPVPKHGCPLSIASQCVWVS